MKLVNAKLYEAEIKKKMEEIWYDEKYQYYFGGGVRRWDFNLDTRSDDWPRIAYAVLDSKDELIGYIAFCMDEVTRVAMHFGAVNFSDNKVAFALALKQVIKNCFEKFGANVVEWNVICGNPIEPSYDRMCTRLGGRICSYKRNRVVDMAGNLHDEKTYEILREDFRDLKSKVDLEIVEA